MRQNNTPENDPIGHLVSFMPKEALREECSWPPTRKFAGMQAFLAHTPIARNARLCFVVPVQHTCPGIDEDEIDREVVGECWIDPTQAVEAVERRDKGNQEERGDGPRQ